ncbi:MAG: site-specific integrase [Lyngbya sp.]|nr:site-specific integrase [Lyngbya sp.]
MLRHIQRSPFANVDPNLETTGYAQNILDWASQTLSPDTCRRLMVQLNACLKWAIESSRVQVARSPFDGLAAKAKKRIKRSSEETDINPFTKSERDAIIENFRVNQNIHHYYYVTFCFYTGCRPSEAIGLTWNDVSWDLKKITFREAVVAAAGGKKRCIGLKTQVRRVFPCNEQVQSLLAEIKENRSVDYGPVLTSTTGGEFSTSYFRKVWQRVLSNLRIEYRKPYQTRHTFITLYLEVGVDVKDLAKWVGNSPEVIYRHYAGKKMGLIPPRI